MYQKHLRLRHACIRTCLLALCLQFATAEAGAQEKSKRVKHTFGYQGQLSGWGQFTPDIDLPLWFGGRYIPQFNYGAVFQNGQKIDFELSADLYGEIGTRPFSDFDASGKIKPYRAWGRYSTQQMEVRLGLQKINFGSAQLFRPLMWFDAMDPRDPLQLTDGVWGGLFRYYFQNNANVWFWMLYANKKTKGWEFVPSSQSFPEIGGRAQLPLKQGEVALSYHFRKTDLSTIGLGAAFETIPENRLGVDFRLDRVIGIWLEGSWVHVGKNIGAFTNQQMITLGGDYTFGIGNGLGLTAEQLVYSCDEKAFAFKNTITLTGLTLTYPLTLFDNLNFLFFYDWMSNQPYSFLNWQHDFSRLSLYCMLYWNPQGSTLPGQVGSERFEGKGIRVMLVWNH